MAESGKQKRCVVFDFDCTLTKEHWWKTMNWDNYKMRLSVDGWDQESKTLLFIDSINYRQRLHESKNLPKAIKLLEYIWGGNERLEKIKGFLKKLKENRVDIFVSTNGQANEVEGVLKASEVGIDIFGYIHGYDDTRFGKKVIRTQKEVEPSDSSKEWFINYLKEVENYEVIIYIDDDNGEYLSIQQLGVITIENLPKEKGGMTDIHMKDILTKLGIHVEQAGGNLDYYKYLKYKNKYYRRKNMLL